MSGRLDGKVALITGAGCVGPGWGNGRAAAVLFAREGAQVFAVDLKPEPMEETVARATAEAANGGTIRTHLADATDDAQVAAMVEACIAAYGRIDILVNNVGGSAKGGAVALSEEAWDRQIDFNLKSVFLTCKHVIPHMEAGGGGVDRQHRFHLRAPVDRVGAGRIRRVQSRGDPIRPGHGGGIRPKTHSGEHGGAGPDAHSHGGGPPGRAARRRGYRRTAQKPRGSHSARLHGGRAGHRQRRAVPRLRRGAVHYRDRDRGRWRHDRALRLRGARCPRRWRRSATP